MDDLSKVSHCEKCGNSVHEEDMFANAINKNANSNAIDESNVAYTIIGAFIPWYLTLIIYCIMKKNLPLTAKSFLYGVFVNLIFAAIIMIFYIFIFAVVLMSGEM